MIKLKYGNTNTFFMNGLLVDTDYAGTLPAFYKALKANGISIKDIRYVLATHYHPDHMGIIGSLVQQGVKHLLLDVQKDQIHYSDYIVFAQQLLFLARAARFCPGLRNSLFIQNCTFFQFNYSCAERAKDICNQY